MKNNCEVMNMSFGIIPFLGRSKERETIELLKGHVDIVCKSVDELSGIFSDLEKGDYTDLEEKRNRVSNLEADADRKRREIEESLYKGAFLPMSRSQIFNFAENVDRIAGIAEDLAKGSVFLEGKNVPRELLSLLQEQLGKTIRCVDLLKECMENIDDTENLRKLIADIRMKEHELDDYSDRSLHALYDCECDAKTLLILSQLIRLLSNIPNQAEDASDVLSLIMLQHHP